MIGLFVGRRKHIQTTLWCRRKGIPGSNGPRAGAGSARPQKTAASGTERKATIGRRVSNMRSEQPDAENKPSAKGAGRAAHWTLRLALAALAGIPCALKAQSFTLSTQAGDINIPLGHVDASGSLINPAAPSAPPFTAPTIFSAPLPSGSGARALGVAGAFTAVADDATAASWNPAGLTQLERPEFSVVYRLSHERDQHWSGDSDYRVGEDDCLSHDINYMSGVMPFRLLDHNVVVSLNYQEVYDFSSRFHADFSDRSLSQTHQVSSENTSQTLTIDKTLDNGTLHVTEDLTTRKTTTLDQTTSSETLGELGFDQEGGVQAITPALAIEITPKISVGASLNVYQEGLLDSAPIRSRTHASYSGSLNSLASVTDVRTTTGRWAYNGWYVSPTIQFPISDAGDVPPYSTTETSEESTRLHYRGTYDVDDRIDDFRGVNATLGSLWNVSEKLTLGFCLDLPWTARAHQTKTASTEVEVADESGQRVSRTSSTTRESKDVTFDFPLYWAAGAVWHWNNRLSTSLDLSQTWWSNYSFKAKGESRTNPLDGTPYGEHPLDDCWALRTGTEYLWVLSKTEIPLRAGLSWEQRPAVNSPDEYWGVSLGTGISLGKGANKVIIDIAYIYSWGSDVMGTLVPGQQGNLGTDVQRHDVYVSCIYHF